MVRKKRFDLDAESLDMIEDDDCGFIEGDVEASNVIKAFSFAPASPAAEPAPSNTFDFNKSNTALTDNRKIKTEANVTTPKVDDEPYTVGRYYKIRYSTAKMLNEIKASHDNVNVYMNTIVDEAIRYYYEFELKVINNSQK
ncbi:hypothetical protein JK636_07175 [Clostridium sp. YIM B02515]|uniref:Uncharacterized protein n=1 Tax=Clostridium rhizosphaerae TaxID=2803861 RepID=A0ABS1TB33_9CLOT|nr:hypothetical protein [Clostridium rhizosphaerae]MBL4935539.1 hypothetical protein [Clostridium rhizosphaerae]